MTQTESQPLTVSLVQTMIVLSKKDGHTDLYLIREDFEFMSKADQERARDYANRWGIEIVLI